jgi:hypothetical protein
MSCLPYHEVYNEDGSLKDPFNISGITISSLYTSETACNEDCPNACTECLDEGLGCSVSIMFIDGKEATCASVCVEGQQLVSCKAVYNPNNCYDPNDPATCWQVVFCCRDCGQPCPAGMVGSGPLTPEDFSTIACCPESHPVHIGDCKCAIDYNSEETVDCAKVCM